MQSGLENMPIFVQPGMSLVYQPQGINIIMAPSYNVNFSSQAIFVDKNDENNMTQVDPTDEDTDQENQAACDLSEEQLQNYKQKICQHPLYPLVSTLFEICDQLTHSSNFNPSKNVNGEIQNFMVRCHHEGISICTGDSEVDELMIETVKVMKIHILEIEMVQELCKDFCTRYINCLKSTLHSSQLVPPDLDDDSDTSAEATSGLSPMKGSGGVIMQTNLMSSVAPITALGQGQVVSGGTVYQMVQTPHGLVAQPIQVATSNSQMPTRTLQEHVSMLGFNGSVVNTSNLSLVDNMYNQEEDATAKKARRGVLPKKATRVMKAWLFQHISHPYPTEDEKLQIASQTNLTLLQVNNWFINGRRRILQPMLNSAAPVINKYKSRRQTKKSTQRFWPNNIASSKRSESTETGTEEDGDDEGEDEDGESDETDSDVEHANLEAGEDADVKSIAETTANSSSRPGSTAPPLISFLNEPRRANISSEDAQPASKNS